MPSTRKTHAQRAADVKAAMDAVSVKLRAVKREYRVLVGDDETDPDRSIAGLRQRYLADDPDVTPLDVIAAEMSLPLVEAKIDRLTERYNVLRDRELTMDLSLCEALAPAVADALGGIPVEVTLELPEQFNPAHAPRAYVVPFGRVKRDPESGALSGQARIHYLRSEAHRTPEIDVNALSIAIEDHVGTDVFLQGEARSRAVGVSAGAGLKIDQAQLDVRFALPHQMTFAAGHTPDGARSLVEGVAYRAALSVSTMEKGGGYDGSVGSGIISSEPHLALGTRQVDNATISDVTVEGGIRRVTVRGDIALSPQDSRGEHDVTTAARVLRTEVESTVGLGQPGLGRVSSARIVRDLGPITHGGRGGFAVKAEFVVESAVEGATAADAA